MTVYEANYIFVRKKTKSTIRFTKTFKNFGEYWVFNLSIYSFYLDSSKFREIDLDDARR